MEAVTRHTQKCVLDKLVNVTKAKVKKKKFPAVSVPLYNNIYGDLLHAIFRGDLRPGTLLSEESLADRFGVSRTPIREALVHLINDGFLDKAAFRSYVVAEISGQSVREVYDLRLLLEPAAAEQAAKNVFGASALDEAQKTIEEMRSFSPSEKDIDKLIGFSEVDARFHGAIAEASGNKRMVKFVSDLTKHNQRFWMLLAPEGPSFGAATISEHSEVLQAIRSRKPDQAAKLIRDHLMKARSRLKV